MTGRQAVRAVNAGGAETCEECRMKMNAMPSAFVKVSLVLTIFALAAFLRLYRLGQVPPGLHPDEAMNGINALEAWRTGHFAVFYAENGGREGLFINAQALALGLIGQNEPWVLRLVSAIFGTLTVVAFYYFSRELFDEWVARLGALFMATSFWHINVSRIGTRPVAALFFLLWALYLFCRSAGELAKGSRRYWAYAIGAGVLYGLGFHTYSAYRVTPLMVAAMLPQMSRQFGPKNLMKVGGLFLAATMLAVLPLALYFLRHQADFLQRIETVSIFAAPHPLGLFLGNVGKTAGMYMVAGDLNWRHNVAGHPMLFMPVALLCLPGIVLAVLHYRWLLAFWAAGALPAVLSTEGMPHALRSILTIPAALLAAAVGGVWLWRRMARRLPPLGAHAVPYLFAAWLAVAAYHTYFITWGTHRLVAASYYDVAVDIARRLQAAPRGIPKYVILTPEPIPYVRDLPSTARPIMFLTDTFSPEKRQEQQMHFLLSDQTNQIPPGALVGFIPFPAAL